MGSRRFAVDTFPTEAVGRLISVSGWLMPVAGENTVIDLRIDGQPQVSLLRYYRHDVASVFPDQPLAVRSGFVGDIVVPDWIRYGQSFTLSLCAVTKGVAETLAEHTVTVQDQTSAELKVRHLDIRHLLLDPIVAGAPRKNLSIAGIPHFHPTGQLPIVRLSEAGATHGYSNWALSVVEQSEGFVLDFGSGVQAPERLKDHVVNLDAIHFPYVDVVNSCPDLPFRTGVFSAVISQAVFEHVMDPFHAAKEILRVLTPGGTALIDTAFMQPFHGDPNHYFNMTTSGLRQIMDGFEILELGIRPYQLPSFGLEMQVESILPFVSSDLWRTQLNDLLDRLRHEGHLLNESLGAVGQEVLAAGVYVLARKPT